MTENDRGFNGSHLKPLGLFREGDHSDTRITAMSPNGVLIELNVHPQRVDGGTLFVPKRGQQEELRQLFPPPNRQTI